MLAPILMLVMAAQTTPADPRDRGSALFNNCQINVKMTPEDTLPNYQAAAACTAYIDGYTDGIETGKYFCVGGATLGTLARVYVAYMEKHPKLMDIYKSEVLFLALLESYPCPIKKK